MTTETKNAAGFARKTSMAIFFVASLLVGNTILSCHHDSILEQTPPNPNGHWHGYIDCGGQLGDFGFTIAVDDAGTVTGTGGEACHLSTSTFAVTGNFINPDLSLTMTWTGSTSTSHFQGTLQADTIFNSAGGLPKLVRLSD
jgi:hypothetical protein